MKNKKAIRFSKLSKEQKQVCEKMDKSFEKIDKLFDEIRVSISENKTLKTGGSGLN